MPLHIAGQGASKKKFKEPSKNDDLVLILILVGIFLLIVGGVAIVVLFSDGPYDDENLNVEEFIESIPSNNEYEYEYNLAEEDVQYITDVTFELTQEDYRRILRSNCPSSSAEELEVEANYWFSDEWHTTIDQCLSDIGSQIADTELEKYINILQEG